MLQLQLNVKKVTVLIRDGTDKVALYTDLPSTFPGWLPHEPMILEFECTHGLGRDYVQAVFGIEPEVIDTLAMRAPIKELVSMLEEEQQPTKPHRRYPLQQRAAERIAKRAQEQTEGYMRLIRKQGEDD